MCANLKVFLAHAETHAERAPSCCKLSMGPRFRKDDVAYFRGALQ